MSASATLLPKPLPGPLSPLKITAIYALVGVLWVPITDQLLLAWVGDESLLTLIQTFKGGVFVLATAILLYLLIKRSVRLLRQEHARLKAVIESTPDTIFIRDTRGRYILINTAGARYLGKSVDEVLGREAAALFPPDTAHTFLEEDRQILAGGEAKTFEHPFTMAGRTRIFSCTKAPYRDTEGHINGVIGISRDITERNRQESLLAGEKRILEMIANDAILPEMLKAITLLFEEQTQEKAFCSLCLLDADRHHLRHGAAPGLPESYTRAIDGMAIGPAAGSCGTAAYRGERVVVTDIATDPLWKDYRDLALRHGLRACWSVPIVSSQRKVLGTFAIYHPEPCGPAASDLEFIDRASHLAGIAIERTRAEEALQSAHDELERRVYERTAELAKTNARLRQEIAGRQQTEAALRESEERFRQLVEHLDEVFWIANADGSQVLYVSPAYETIRGHSREHIYANPADWLEAIHPEDQSRLPDLHAEIVTTGKCEEEYRIIRPDGTVRWIWSRGFPVRDAAGHIYRIAGIGQDITGRKTNEEKLRQQQAELAHLARFALANEMTSGLAHELNQPLGAIRTYAETCLLLIHAGSLDREALIETLEQVTAQAQRAAEIIRRLRNLVRKAEPQRSPVNINGLIQDTIALIEPEARQQAVQIRLELDEALPSLFADSIQIQQVVLNLVRNAIEAMSKSQVEPRILTIHTASAGSEALEVAVSDTGPGLSSEARERLFMPFFTTKATGMGLGLPLSKSIIEAHGGNLWATANPDREVTFHFTLPYELRKKPR